MSFHKILVILGFLLLTAPLAAAPVNFHLKDLDGNSHSLSDYRGKWVIVNFWATWCPPCLEEIPDLVTFHESHKDLDAVVIGINFEEATPEQLRVFVDDYFISYPILLSPGLDAPTPAMTIAGLPTTYIVSPEGELVARQVGPVTAQLIEEFLERKIATRNFVKEAGSKQVD